MSYSKPRMIAENKAMGSFAAGCPPKDQSLLGIETYCRQCERTV